MPKTILHVIFYYYLFFYVPYVSNCRPISYKCCWYSQVQIHNDVPNHDFLGEMKLGILQGHHLTATSSL
ncbi:hypothetical protein BDE02_14G129400 [Populus trichocarpa]|nr:hypothetical protein BDE02_14G129400 [Populus trichocarpa]